MLYNAPILIDQMERLGKTPEQIAADAKISVFSVNMGLAGRLGTLKKLKQLADALKVDWRYITHVDLPESQFHRALIAKRERRGVR